MSYGEDIRSVVEANRDDIEADLEIARDTVRMLERQLADAKAQVSSFETLLGIARLRSAIPDSENGYRRMSLHEAMRTVLKSAPQQMMRPADITTEINRRGLYRMLDGRPVEKHQVHARANNYPKMFERVGTFIKLI